MEGVEVKVKIVNLGSCNGCELEILDLLYREPGLRLCERDEEADVVLLTGVLTETNRARAERVRLRADAAVLRVGSCGISQGLFLPPDGALDRVAGLGDRAAELAVGCPPSSSEIAEALRTLEKERKNAHA
jgi:Ni,Fe-hydrogenase III small subunit